MLGRDGFMAAARIRRRASSSGLAGDFDGVPATAEVVAPGGAAPTVIPGGRPFPAPDPLPEPLPEPVTFGVPGASGLPPGDAWTSPLRLPPGASMGPCTSAGLSPSAMSCPWPLVAARP